MVGWAYRQFKQNKDNTTIGAYGMQGFYDESGELQTGKVIALSRPYQPKTQGTLNSAQYDPYTRQFKSEFIINRDLEVEDYFFDGNKVGAITTIFLNKKLYFPEGYDVVIKQGPSGWGSYVTSFSVKELDPQGDFISIYFHGSNKPRFTGGSALNDFESEFSTVRTGDLINISVQPKIDLQKTIDDFYGPKLNPDTLDSDFDLFGPTLGDLDSEFN